VGSTSAIAVRTDDWAGAFEALAAAGAPIVLAGRTIRVAGAEPDAVRRILAAAGVEARLEPVRATIEERMVLAGETATTR
jgi:ABC-2 type transport system ATP-binding protein/ribosome-dependent ATPase